MTKKSARDRVHILGTIHNMVAIYGTHVQSDNISPWLSHFFKFLIFWVARGIKVQKMVQNDKKLFRSCSISQEAYIMVVIYGTILTFLFSRLWLDWKGKKWHKISKISVCRTLYFRNHISYDLYLWYTCMYKRIISPGIFIPFFDFDNQDH